MQTFDNEKSQRIHVQFIFIFQPVFLIVIFIMHLESCHLSR